MSADGPRMQVYLWDRCFLLQGQGYELDRRHNPYHRPSATLLVAHEGTFELGINGEPLREYEAVLLPVNIRRDWITSHGRPFTLMDACVSSEAYLRLAPYLTPGQPLVLAAALRDRLRGLLAHREPGTLDIEAAVALFGEAVEACCDPPRPQLQREPRIQRVMQEIERLPLDQLSHEDLSREAQLSASRLRALFQRHVGCTISQYMRWVAGSKAAQMWREGSSFTEIALAAGFYDLAHADRVMNEIFGMNPSVMTDPRQYRLHFRR